MISTMIYALSFLIAFAHAIPVQVRDVVAPPITSPTAGAIWHVGETQTVTWNTSVIPPSVNITNTLGMLVLGYSTWENENLDLDNPLASNFSIEAGQISFVVPEVPTKDNYIVCLFGDSGDISQNFTIIGTSASSSSVVSSSAVPASSGVLAEPSSSAPLSATSSVSVVLTTQVVTSLSVTTVPGPTSVAGSSSALSKAGPSAGTTLPASFSSAPASSALPSASSVSESDPSGSTAAPSSPSVTASDDSTSGAWSWRSTTAMQPWSIALLVMVVCAML